MKKLFFVSLLTLLFIGCGGSKVEVVDPYAKPAWISSPGMSGAKGYVGVAPQDHFYGPARQKKIAEAYALEGLSRQLGVTVTASIATVTTERGSAYVDQAAHESSNKVTATLKDSWTDKKTKELYVWMVLDN